MSSVCDHCGVDKTRRFIEGGRAWWQDLVSGRYGAGGVLGFGEALREGVFETLDLLLGEVGRGFGDIV